MEKVKLFWGQSEEIEENYNKWMEKYYSSVEIIERKYQEIYIESYDKFCSAIVIFYREKLVDIQPTIEPSGGTARS